MLQLIIGNQAQISRTRWCKQGRSIIHRLAYHGTARVVLLILQDPHRLAAAVRRLGKLRNPRAHYWNYENPQLPSHTRKRHGAWMAWRALSCNIDQNSHFDITRGLPRVLVGRWLLRSTPGNPRAGFGLEIRISAFFGVAGLGLEPGGDSAWPKSEGRPASMYRAVALPAPCSQKSAALSALNTGAAPGFKTHQFRTGPN